MPTYSVNLHLSVAIAYNLCMSEMEKKSRERTRNANLQKVILGTVATAGILSVALLAPNALGVLKSLGFTKGRRVESVKEARKRLVNANLLAYQDGWLKLTSKGEAKLRQLELHEYRLKKPRKWDNKWRILIFDIKEERRSLREKVRRTLISVGFERLQDSVWVYPYDCGDLIALLKTDFKIGRELLYLIVENIENDRWLRDRFGLKKLS